MSLFGLKVTILSDKLCIVEYYIVLNFPQSLAALGFYFYLPFAINYALIIVRCNEISYLYRSP